MIGTDVTDNTIPSATITDIPSATNTRSPSPVVTTPGSVTKPQ